MVAVVVVVVVVAVVADCHWRQELQNIPMMLRVAVHKAEVGNSL